MGFGTALYLSSQYEAGARDGLMLALSERFSLSIRLTRTLMEIIVVFVGWLMEGPVFIGTISTIAPVVQFFLPYSNMFLKSLYNKQFTEE